MKICGAVFINNLQGDSFNLQMEISLKKVNNKWALHKLLIDKCMTENFYKP